MKKVAAIILVLSGLALLSGCNDPNEANVPDGKDFKNSKVTVDNSKKTVITDVRFYADFALAEFFYYFDHDNDCSADFLVRCNPGQFKVLKESAPGLFDIEKYTGTPTVSGANYHLEFPWSALEVSPDFTTYYWFYAMDGGDRMPDSVKELLAVVH